MTGSRKLLVIFDKVAHSKCAYIELHNVQNFLFDVIRIERYKMVGSACVIISTEIVNKLVQNITYLYKSSV